MKQRYPENFREYADEVVRLAPRTLLVTILVVVAIPTCIILLGFLLLAMVVLL